MRIFLMIFTLALGFAMPAEAQSNLEYNRYLIQLSEWNRSQPLQRPSTERYDELLERHVTDSQNKVIGEVQNIIVDPTGSVASLQAELDRLQLSSSIFLNVADMNIVGTSNNYEVGFEGAQLEDIYPELLANIETAAGGSGSFAVSSVIGQRVTSDDGRFIGNVENVIFNNTGSRAEALYIAVQASALRGRGVAVPFGSVRYFPKGNTTEVSITRAQADAIIETGRRR